MKRIFNKFQYVSRTAFHDIPVSDHSFSTYTKFSEKLKFPNLTPAPPTPRPLYAHLRVRNKE